MSEIIQSLEEIGLSEKEIQVYLALLNLGEETASRVSEIANLNRITTYTLLKSLKEKGFCSSYNKNKVQYFKPIKPEEILNILEFKKEKLKLILPGLESLKSSITKKPEISVYEGKEGLKTVFEGLLKEKPKEHLIMTTEKIFKILEFYFPHFINRKENLKIKTKILGPKNKEASKYVKKYNKNFRKIKELKDFNFFSRIEIYNNKVLIINLEKENLISILIHNNNIANSFRGVFEKLWKK
jgi:HTH-type transcriptional regulator, sugar sensing transcriptional regulator